MRTAMFIILLQLNLSCLQAQEQDFPYSLTKKDIWIISLGTGIHFTSQHLSNKYDHNLSVSEISSLDRNTINSFDRNATYFWNRSADDVSNVIFRTLPFTPLAVTIPQLKNKKWKHAGTIGLMYVEVFLVTNGITGTTKSIVGRTRPYLYNTSFTPEERHYFQEHGAPVGSTSFFSGHASTTFAAAIFLSKMYTDIYGKGTWSTIIWCSSLSLASVTAYCRVAAGEHFPTDVIAGAIVGSAIGYLIPTLHKKDSKKISLSVLPNYFCLTYKL